MSLTFSLLLVMIPVGAVLPPRGQRRLMDWLSTRAQKVYIYDDHQRPYPPRFRTPP